MIWYNYLVKTSFYASGFLYNPKTNQILLLQSSTEDDVSPFWSILGGESREGEDAQITFQRIVHELLNVDIKMKHIYPVYDYFHEKLDKINYVFYAEVKNPRILKPIKKRIFSWMNFSETSKLPFSARTKQDVIVGERVINLKKRLDQGLQ